MLEWYYILAIAFGLLLSLLLLGVPVFVGFLLLNLAGVYWFMGYGGIGILVNSIFSSSTSTSLAAIPLFILMGEILFRSGSVEVLIDAIGKLIGQIRGRLYYFVIALSALFGALSGSAIAVTAMLSKTALRLMISKGYNRKFSIGMILSGASLAPIIPPSTLAVIVGSIADVSIAKLLIAGILPGLLLIAIFTAYIWIMIAIHPEYAPDEVAEETVNLRGKLRALLNCLPFGVVMFGVMGFIMLGIATATEAAATGVTAAILVAAYYRKLSLSMLAGAIRSAVSITAMLMVIIASSTLFTQLLAFTGASSGLVSTVRDMEIGPYMFIVIALGITFVMCMFIDEIAYVMLAVPILGPILNSYGIDPVFFWLLFLVFLSTGSNTPPFGYNLFTVKAVVKEVEMNEIFSSAWRICWLIISGAGIMIVFPSIVTVLPSLM